MGTLKKYVLPGLGFCEILFYSGIIYGWAALVYVLKEEGFYSHLCQNQTMHPADEDIATISCVKQDAILNLIFTISSFVLQGSLFLFGVLFDNLGTRFTRLLLHILLVAGFVTMLLSSPSLPQLLFPGMILLALGGGQFIPANFQIGNLFKNHHATVRATLSGAFDSSAAVFVLVKLGYDGGISLQTSFAIMIGITALFLINTFLLMPVDHIHSSKDDSNQDDEINNPNDETRSDNQERVSHIVRGPYADLEDSVTGFVVTTILYILFSIVNLISILEVQYLTFALQVITRTFFYAIAVAIIPIMFPSRYFGSLFGLLSTTGSVVLLLQFPLFLLTQHVFDDDPLVINAILLIACLFTLTLPIYIFISTKRKNKEIGSRRQNKVLIG
ncbi:equilibrative nucleobase transporter 1-like [Amphiura filiformis]|uniref:equilibrative nucleobase transporter 1-like n=1 Tax=Amphiura filiformis TaxID=82378 RepID=UPI003B2167A1